MAVGVTGPVKFKFKTGEIDRHAMAFWCVMIPRHLFDEIGLLDEIFDPGMGEDGDFCIKAELAGYSLVQVPADTSTTFGEPLGDDFPIMHVGSGTFGWMNADGIIERNKKILDDRYGVPMISNMLSSELVSDFQRLYYNTLIKDSANREVTTWKGVTCLKCPTDMWAYQEIINEVKPDVIIETGTYLGGSALYLAHVCDSIGKGKIISIDIEQRNNLPSHPRIEYVVGSSVSNETLSLVKNKIVVNSTVLVILDSEHTKDHVLTEIHMYAPLVSKGSFLIVEDTNISTVLPEFGPGPIDAVTEFLRSNNEFEVDQKFDSKFLVTFNPSGYLRKKEKQNEYYNGLNAEILYLMPPASGKVIEFGCANGLLGERYKLLNPGTHWTGIENNAKAVLIASKKLDVVKQLDIDTITSSDIDQKFDVVVFGDLLEHLKYPEKFLDLTHTISTDNAILVCCIPNMTHISIIEQMLAGDIAYTDSGLLDRTHLRFLSIFSVMKMLLDSGWMPHMASTNYSVDHSAFLNSLTALSEEVIGVNKEIAQRNLVTYQYYFTATKSPTAKSVLTKPFDVVIPVNNQKQFDRNIGCSPGLTEANANVIVIKDALNASDALEKGRLAAQHDWVILCHQDVYFPKGSGQLISEILCKVDDEVEVIGFAGIDVNGDRAGLVIDRVRPFSYPESDSAVSVDEFAVAIRTKGFSLDPAFGWHLWATDLCLRINKDTGKKVHIVRVPLFHNSYNQNKIPADFSKSVQVLEKKHINYSTTRIKTVLGDFLKGQQHIMTEPTVVTDSLEVAYEWCKTNISDINEHIETIRKYATGCDHITEFGTRGCVSTYALMAAKPKKLLTYDIVVPGNIWTADSIAKDHNISFGFMERNTIQIGPIDQTDLLFIDTLHNYAQLKKELAIHAPQVRKYLLFHDTTTFGYVDEIPDETNPNGIAGLWPAIQELIDQGEWKLVERFENCNGLTVLERIQEMPKLVKYSIVIPTYNHCDDLLKPCLESIIEFTDLSNVEVIIVANGCVDNTKEYVESLGDPFKLIWIEEAYGYTKSTNVGIRAATGEYVILLNNDTQILPSAKNEWLSILERPFLEKQMMGMTGPLELFDRYANMPVLIFFCVMIRRELFDKIGLLNEVFSPGGGEDIDFTGRIRRAGYEAVCIDETVYNGHTNVGFYPMWHKDNRTFGEIPEYTNWIIKRNGHINCKEYNRDIKLNLGAGGVDYPGYLSVDLYDKRAHIKMDITKLDFYENSVSEILASHVFEHLNPYHSTTILSDWLKVLKPGGKLIMEMPDIEKLCEKFLKSDTGGRYGVLNAIYGSVNTTNEGGPDNITSPHLFGWWPQSIADHLHNAGYENIVIMDEQIPHPETNFRVEATKPLGITRSDLQTQDPNLYFEIFERNEYFAEATDIAGKDVLDLGANAGYFSFLATELNANSVVAVEANPNNFARLVTNTKGLRRVTTLNKAVWSENDATVLISDNTVLSTIGDAGIPVSTVTLEKLSDGICNGVLKLDVEGAEFEILKNVPNEILQRFTAIFIELHGSEQNNPEVIRSQLAAAGFERKTVFQYWTNDTSESDPGDLVDIFIEKWIRV